jgi:hypothetical protein
MPARVKINKKGRRFLRQPFTIMRSDLSDNFYLAIEISSPTATIHVFLL